jgi:hypothetical protein
MFALHAVGGSALSKVLRRHSDGTDNYPMSATPQGTVLVWVDGLLETDYTVAGTTLTFGAASRNSRAIVAWDIVGGGIAVYDISVHFPGELGPTRLCSGSPPRAFTLPRDLTGSQGYTSAPHRRLRPISDPKEWRLHRRDHLRIAYTL